MMTKKKHNEKKKTSKSETLSLPRSLTTSQLWSTAETERMWNRWMHNKHPLKLFSQVMQKKILKLNGNVSVSACSTMSQEIKGQFWLQLLTFERRSKVEPWWRTWVVCPVCSVRMMYSLWSACVGRGEARGDRCATGIPGGYNYASGICLYNGKRGTLDSP